jgi:hypothetical protein
VIDSMTVVRLKRGLLETSNRDHWGSRTDYLCACSPHFDNGRFPFWLARRRDVGTKKATTGLCAVLEAIERLSPASVSVIGFDRLMRPENPDPPHTWLAHDKWAEHEILKQLGVKELGQVC